MLGISMRTKIKLTIELVFLVLVIGLLTWHVISWQSSGRYWEMLQWVKSGKGYLTALYDLGIIIVIGVTLSLTIDRLTSLLSSKPDNPHPAVERLQP
jgi:hypothetical protein